MDVEFRKRFRWPEGWGVSLPDSGQSKVYAAGNLHGLDHPVLVLLSLVAPGWRDGSWTTPNGLTWRYRSHEDLCAALRSCLPDLRRADGFGADVFEHWLDLIDKLVRLAAEVGTPAGGRTVAGARGSSRNPQERSTGRDRAEDTLPARLEPRPARAGAGDRAGRRHRADRNEPRPGHRGDVHRGDDPLFGWQIQEGQFWLVHLTGPARHGGRSASRRPAPAATTSALTGRVPCWATSVPSDPQPPRMLRWPSTGSRPTSSTGASPRRT